MENELEVIVDPINEEEAVEETPEQETPAEEVPVERPAETPEAKVARLRRQLKQAEKRAGIVEKPVVIPPQAVIDAEEVANLSVVFNGLDTAQRAKLIKEVRSNGLEVNSKTLEEARRSEDYLLWDSAYQTKVAKEKAPAPTTTQPESEIKRTWKEIVNDPSTPLEEREKILIDKGLMKAPNRREKITRLSI